MSHVSHAIWSRVHEYSVSIYTSRINISEKLENSLLNFRITKITSSIIQFQELKTITSLSFWQEIKLLKPASQKKNRKNLYFFSHARFMSMKKKRKI